MYLDRERQRTLIENIKNIIYLQFEYENSFHKRM